MDFDAVAYLAGHGLRGRAASGGREMTYPCFLDCGEAPDSKKRKLYLNVADGFYHCKVCNASGGSYSLQQHFGDDPRAGSSNDAFTRRQILDAAADVGMTMLDNNDNVLLYLLNERGLDYETVKERKLGFIAGTWSLVGNLSGFTSEQIRSTGLVHKDGARAGDDFFYRHILIPYISHGHVIQMRGRVWGEGTGGKYMTGPGEPVRLFNADSLHEAEEVIVTEGEFDAIILAQQLAKSPEPRAKKIAVVAVPGTNAIPEEFDQVLSEARRIYIGFDNDVAGAKAAETLAERIGKRALILQLPREDDMKCDWTEYLLPSVSREGDKNWKRQHPYAGHDWSDVIRLMATAAGRRLSTISEVGAAYRELKQRTTGLQLGYKKLDDPIRPGLQPGQVMIILAKTGAGKTLFLCNIAYNMRSEKVMFVSLEMTSEEIYERLQRIWLFHHPVGTVSQMEYDLRNIMICDENRLGSKDLGALANEYEIETGERPTVVFVDYLGYYARGFPGTSPYEKTGNAVMELKAEGKEGRFSVITPSQVHRGPKEGQPLELDDARDAGTVEETGDFVLALHNPADAVAVEEQGPEQFGIVKVRYLKSRHGGKGKEATLRRDHLTLVMVDALTTDNVRVQRNNRRYLSGTTWEELRKLDTAPVQEQITGVHRVRQQ